MSPIGVSIGVSKTLKGVRPFTQYEQREFLQSQSPLLTDQHLSLLMSYYLQQQQQQQIEEDQKSINYIKFRHVIESLINKLNYLKMCLISK